MKRAGLASVFTLIVLWAFGFPNQVFAQGSWNTKAPLTRARASHQAEAVGGAVYAVAGAAGGCPGPNLPAEAYNPSDNTWSLRASLGYLGEFATAALGGKIYLFGGGACTAVFSSAVLVYDPVLDTWQSRKPMPTPRGYTPAAAAVNGKIYLIGGSTDPANGAAIAPMLEYNPATDSWTTKRQIPTVRLRARAAVMNGKIYVVGGQSPSGTPLTSIEAYDPATDAWTTTLAPMSIGRISPSVAVLGRLIYVFGGTNFFAFYTSGEAYDPALNTWSSAAPLPVGTVGGGTAALRGLMYVAGGQVPPNASPTSNTFAFTPSGSGTWASTGSMATPRLCCSGGLTMLADGRVLVAGGWTGGSATSGAEIYDPGLGKWLATGNMTVARRGHVTTALANGKVLAAGGADSAPVKTAELYDPATGSWSATASMATGRYGGSAVLLLNGKVLVTAGYRDGGPSTPQATAELYDPATGLWSATGSMSVARISPTLTVLQNGNVLAVGGWNGGSLASAELYDPVTGLWSPAGTMMEQREGHTATLLASGKVLIAGGETTNVGLASAELYNPSANTWSSTGNMTTGRWMPTATLLASGRVLVAGGISGNAIGVVELRSAELYDPATGTWGATGNLVSARGEHSAALLNSVWFSLRVERAWEVLRSRRPNCTIRH